MTKLREGVTAYQGRQVPYTLLWTNGHPDFKSVDPEKVKRCLLKRLCGICGEALGLEVVFIGGENSTYFIDPPNHPECVATARAECPFIKNHRKRADQNGDSGVYRTFTANDYGYDPADLTSWPVGLRIVGGD